MLVTSTIILSLTSAACVGSVVAYQPGLREKVWTLLGKRPLVPPKRTWAMIFRVNAKTVTKAELDTRHRELQAEIRKDSFFKVGDRTNLNRYYDDALAFIQKREAAKLEEALKQSEAEFNNENRRQGEEQPKGLVVSESKRWRELLEVGPKERDPKVIKHAYRRKAQLAHPDRGGSHDAMSSLNKAYATAKRELSFN